MMSHPDMQKIWIIGFIFENRLHWWFKVGGDLQTAVLGYVFIYIQIKYLYIIPYMYLTNGEKFKP
jgi:hypothetical protein